MSINILHNSLYKMCIHKKCHFYGVVLVYYCYDMLYLQLRFWPVISYCCTIPYFKSLVFLNTSLAVEFFVNLINNFLLIYYYVYYITTYQIIKLLWSKQDRQALSNIPTLLFNWQNYLHFYMSKNFLYYHLDFKESIFFLLLCEWN